ncbi:hypothetical protein Taro_051746 [Colocasia esculenta]|uniref:Uncharacterized protein n=1 Tax=Colocasia esculenta TaxID=4460 RepID=A0A843XHR9_COLES|nr:hypothetical protein [Colocasia esculenta]
MSQVDLTVEQGIATCPMSPSGLLKATGPMSPSYVQRVKCSGREHKPQFAPLLCESLISGELKLGSSVEAWEEVVDHLASVVEALKKGASVCCTLGCAGLGVAIMMATPGLSPSQSEKGLGNLLSTVLLQVAGFARVVGFGSSRGKWWDSDVVVCGALLAETGTPVVGARRGTVVRPDYGSCGYLWFRVSLRREVSDMDRWSRLGSCGALVYTGETSQQFPPRRSEETGPQ